MTLYRTHRPKHFRDLLGQNNASKVLQQALIQNRVSHAYLFSGPRGCGKTSAARILARAVACLNPIINKEKTSFEPCNECANCQAILGGRCIDLLEIDAASNRGIDDIRQLKEQCLYPPSELKKRIYIIDEVHMLSLEAFNALLKTLEEPPEHCLFILATTEPHKIPVTVRSRCQIVRFEKGTLTTVQSKLDGIVKAENFQVENGVTFLIAHHTEGGFRDAETILENLTTKHNPLTLNLAHQSLGILTDDRANNLLKACFSQNSAEVLKELSELKPDLETSPERIISQLINKVRDLLYSEQISTNRELLTFGLEQLMQAYILQKHTPVITLPLEIAILNICNYKTAPAYLDHPIFPNEIQSPHPTQKNPNKVSNLESNTSSVIIKDTIKPIIPSTVPVVEIREKENSIETNPENEEIKADPRASWKKMIEEITKENLILGKTLKEAVFHSSEGNTITINLRFKFHADVFNETKNRRKISSVLEKVSGINWQIVYKVIASTPKRPTANNSLGTGVSDAIAVFSNNSEVNNKK